MSKCEDDLEQLPTQDINLDQLLQVVKSEIDKYSYELPRGSLGSPWSADKVRAELAEMRSRLIPPYWVETEIRDTFEQGGMEEGPKRKCAVVADDDNGNLLLYDPIEKNYVLARRYDSKLMTFGVRGDPVGCFFAR